MAGLQRTWRLVGAALLGTTAGIHAYLYTQGYRRISVIGPLFLLLVIGASILTAVVAAVPARWARPAAAVGALLEAGTAAGLLFIQQHGLFGFQESTRATLFWPSLWVEIAGMLLLGGFAAFATGYWPRVNRSAARAVSGV